MLMADEKHAVRVIRDFAEKVFPLLAQTPLEPEGWPRRGR